MKRFGICNGDQKEHRGARGGGLEEKPGEGLLEAREGVHTHPREGAWVQQSGSLPLTEGQWRWGQGLEFGE